MSGGKGGSTTSEIKVPQYIEDAAKANLAKASAISEVGYTPYYGPDVAAFNPMQQAMFQNTSDVANAFGMATPTDPQDIMGNMGRPQTYANGVTGYSSAPMFQDAVDTLGYFRPNQKALMDSFFVNPNIGFDPNSPYVASPGSGVSLNMMGRNPSFSANTTNYGADSDYYGGSGAGSAGAVTGYGSGISPIMTNNPYTSSGAVSPEAIDPAVQDIVAMRRKSRSDENKARLDAMMDAQMQDYLAKKELGVRQIGGQDVISRSPFDEDSSFAGTNYATYDGSQGFQAPFPLNIAQNIFDPKVKDSGDYGFQNPNTKSVIAAGYDAGEVDPTLAKMAGYTKQIENKPGDYTMFTGRGVDGQGLLGVAGDIAGDIGDGLGLTNFSTEFAIKQRKEAEEARIAAERAATLKAQQEAAAAAAARLNISPPSTSSRRKKQRQAQASANKFTSSQVSRNAGAGGKVTKESYKGGGF
jgi:hypothetical protein